MDQANEIDWQPCVDNFFDFFAQARREKAVLTVDRLREIFFANVPQDNAPVILHAVRTSSELRRLLKQAADTAHPELTEHVSEDEVAGYVANTMIDALEMHDEPRVPLPALAWHGDSLFAHELGKSADEGAE